MKRLGLWILAIAALGGMVWDLALLGSTTSTKPTTSIASEDAVSSTDWITGNQMATHTLVEYGDFQCPACASYYTVVTGLMQKYDTQLRLVFRNFPLPIHQHSQISAQAAGAAGKQGKFWEMYALLYEGQSTWSVLDNPQPIFDGYAKNLGLDVAQFDKDINAADVAEKIARDLASGDRAGVDGTPNFFLDGKKLNNQSYGDLEQSIKNLLESAN